MFCRYAWWLPAHALSAVRVLCAVSESPSAHAPLLAALGGPASSAVLKGFTDVLDDEQGDEFIEQVRTRYCPKPVMFLVSKKIWGDAGDKFETLKTRQ